MNVLKPEKKLAILSALVEGCLKKMRGAPKMVAKKLRDRRNCDPAGLHAYPVTSHQINGGVAHPGESVRLLIARSSVQLRPPPPIL